MSHVHAKYRPNYFELFPLTLWPSSLAIVWDCCYPEFAAMQRPSANCGARAECFLLWCCRWLCLPGEETWKTSRWHCATSNRKLLWLSHRLDLSTKGCTAAPDLIKIGVGRTNEIWQTKFHGHVGFWTWPQIHSKILFLLFLWILWRKQGSLQVVCNMMFVSPTPLCTFLPPLACFIELVKEHCGQNQSHTVCAWVQAHSRVKSTLQKEPDILKQSTNMASISLCQERLWYMAKGPRLDCFNSQNGPPTHTHTHTHTHTSPAFILHEFLDDRVLLEMTLMPTILSTIYQWLCCVCFHALIQTDSFLHFLSKAFAILGACFLVAKPGTLISLGWKPLCSICVPYAFFMHIKVGTTKTVPSLLSAQKFCWFLFNSVCTKLNCGIFPEWLVGGSADHSSFDTLSSDLCQIAQCIMNKREREDVQQVPFIAKLLVMQLKYQHEQLIQANAFFRDPARNNIVSETQTKRHKLEQNKHERASNQTGGSMNFSECLHRDIICRQIWLSFLGRTVTVPAVYTREIVSLRGTDSNRTPSGWGSDVPELTHRKVQPTFLFFAFRMSIVRKSQFVPSRKEQSVGTIM